MFAWERPFGKMIDIARKKELNIIRKNSYVRGLYMTFALFTTRMAVFCTMLSICLLYGSEHITAAKVTLIFSSMVLLVIKSTCFQQIFVISAYFHLIAHSMSQMFVRGIAELAEAYVSVKRLQSFLESDEINDNMIANNDYEQDNIAISAINLKAKWIINEEDLKSETVQSTTENIAEEKEHLFSPHYTLDQINISVKKGSLIGIVGPVASGNKRHIRIYQSRNY